VSSKYTYLFFHPWFTMIVARITFRYADLRFKRTIFKSFRRGLKLNDTQREVNFVPKFLPLIWHPMHTERCANLSFGTDGLTYLEIYSNHLDLESWDAFKFCLHLLNRVNIKRVLFWWSHWSYIYLLQINWINEMLFIPRGYIKFVKKKYVTGRRRRGTKYIYSWSGWQAESI